jgi:hypothetical protein
VIEHQVREHDTGERGSLSVFVVALAGALVVLIGLVVDGGRALAAREAAANVASEAAQEGASQVSVQSLRWDEVGADVSRANQAAAAYYTARGYGGSVRTLDDVVTVTVSTSEPTAVLGLIGIDQIHVKATASASEVHGVTRAD